MKIKTEFALLTIEAGLSVLQAATKHIETVETSGTAVLRWGLVQLKGTDAVLEIVTTPEAYYAEAAKPSPSSSSFEHKRGIYVALVVPTGVGASIGGFIGDAGPVAQVLESVADSVIVHPNVVNGADFFSGGPRSLYVDGLTLDRFFGGHVQLGDSTTIKIGLVLDRLDSRAQSQLLNAANAIRAVNGVELVGYSVCEERVRVRVSRSKFGHFIGELENGDTLISAARLLVERGATSVAVVTAIGGVAKSDWASHYAGNGPNPVGAVEALISRAITWKLGVVCAHAPAFTEELGRSEKVIDPRAAAEVASRSGLPSVLCGLAHAPSVVHTGGIDVRHLAGIIVPFDCAGGPAALAASKFKIPLIAVKSNKCAIGVKADQLSIPNTVAVENYAEAVAFVACRKTGISWESIGRPISRLAKVER